jgi:hypothetical protein
MKTIEITIHKQNYTTSSLLTPGVVFFNLLFVASCFIAVSNLLNQIEVIASTIFLIITLIIYYSLVLSDYDYVSIKYFLIDSFSFYAKREFAVIELKESNPSTVRFGYNFIGFQTFGFSIPIDKIQGVSWNFGQAKSVMSVTGKVFIEFNNNPPLKRRIMEGHMMPTVSNAYLTKDEVQKLGLDFVAFLNKGGAQLTKDKSENRKNYSSFSYNNN